MMRWLRQLFSVETPLQEAPLKPMTADVKRTCVTCRNYLFNKGQAALPEFERAESPHQCLFQTGHSVREDLVTGEVRITIHYAESAHQARMDHGHCGPDARHWEAL